MSQHYSDLQVVPKEEEPKYSLGDPQKAWAPPQHYPSDKIAVQATAYDVPEPVYQDTEQAQLKSKPRNKICGLPGRMFWVVVAIVGVIVIGAAVGGGVGATLSKKSDVKSVSEASAGTSAGTSVGVSTSGSSSTSTSSTSSSASASPATSISSQPQSSTQSATPTTQSTSVTITTTTMIGPSGTLLSDCPSSNETVYAPSSSTQMFRKLCGLSLLNVNNDATAVTVQVSTLDDCVTACAGFNLEYASDIAAGKTEVCNAVCWRSTGGDYGGWCYGYTTQNSSGTFQYGGDARCNSAALINQ